MIEIVTTAVLMSCMVGTRLGQCLMGRGKKILTFIPGSRHLADINEVSSLKRLPADMVNDTLKWDYGEEPESARVV